MKIEFITNDESIGKYIDVISRNLFNYINKQVEPYDLHKHEYLILIELYLCEGLCQEDLVTLLKLKKADIAKAVKKLLNSGYIRKEKDVNDNRIHHLYLTHESLEIKENLISILKDTSEILSQNISKEELNITKKVMKQMSENILRISNN